MASLPAACDHFFAALKLSFPAPNLCIACGGEPERIAMLRWAVIFFISTLVAAVVGFTGVAAAGSGIAQILFYLFVVLFAVTLLGHVARRT